MPKSKSPRHARWNLAAALAGWLLPGLGHFLLGQRRRGVILFISIGLIWACGLGLGGISVIDTHTHPAWFIGQMLMSPSVLVNYYHQGLRQTAGGRPQPRQTSGQPKPAYIPSFGQVHEEGTLYTALAGLLNLLAILDLIYRDPADRRYPDRPGYAGDTPSPSHGKPA